jgi:thiol-disulfide isomerase/thioredoxin
LSTVYADWCGPCKAIAPVYEKLSASLSRTNQITFTKVDTDEQGEVASKYKITTYVLPFFPDHKHSIVACRTPINNISSLPTFVIFKHGKVVEKVGPEPHKLQEIVNKLAAEADGASGSGFGESSSSSDSWHVAELPKGYDDLTDQLEAKGLDLLNADSDFGGLNVLFDSSKPSALQNGKSAEGQAKDWVVSDTDEQLMLFMPFKSNLKVFAFQVSICTSQRDMF